MTVATAWQRLETDTAVSAFRQRLLDGLAESITEVGYQRRHTGVPADGDHPARRAGRADRL